MQAPAFKSPLPTDHVQKACGCGALQSNGKMQMAASIIWYVAQIKWRTHICKAVSQIIKTSAAGNSSHHVHSQCLRFSCPLLLLQVCAASCRCFWIQRALMPMTRYFSIYRPCENAVDIPGIAWKRKLSLIASDFSRCPATPCRIFTPSTRQSQCP